MSTDAPQDVRTRLDYEHRLLNTKLSSGKTLLELSEFDGITLWWFVDSGFNEYIRTYHWGRENRVEKESVSSRFSKGMHVLAWVSALTNSQFLRLTARSLGAPRKAPVVLEDRKRKRILITGENVEWRRMVDLETKKEITTDQFFKPILDIAREEGDDSFVSTFPLRPPLIWALPLFYQSIEVVKDKKAKWDVEHIPFESFSTTKADMKRVRAWIHFSRIWKQVEQDPLLLEVIESEDVGNISRLIGQFRKYFNYDFPEAAWRVEIARRCIQELVPDLVILEEEYGRFERGLIIAARESAIPSLGVQHGLIHEDHKGYMLRKGEIARDLRIEAPFAQVPDKTAVHGEKHRRLLTQNSSYPDEAVEVTGQPRYDRIVRIMENVNREEIQRSISVPTGSKVVLMTMAFNGLPDEENRLYLGHILRSIEEIPGAFLVIKQHPGETESHTRMIREMLAVQKARAVLVPKASDTLGLIWASDLVLTRYSTTGLEAVLFGKPLVVMNLSGQPDPIDFVSMGVAKGVYDASDLRPTMESLLTSVDVEMARAREAYTLDNVYKMDGKASLRLYGLICRMLMRKLEKEKAPGLV